MRQKRPRRTFWNRPPEGDLSTSPALRLRLLIWSLSHKLPAFAYPYDLLRRAAGLPCGYFEEFRTLTLPEADQRAVGGWGALEGALGPEAGAYLRGNEGLTNEVVGAAGGSLRALLEREERETRLSMETSLEWAGVPRAPGPLPLGARVALVRAARRVPTPAGR